MQKLFIKNVNKVEKIITILLYNTVDEWIKNEETGKLINQRGGKEMENTKDVRQYYSHACAVRMTEDAAALLRTKAHEYSLKENTDISVSDIIRVALIAKYGEEYRKLLES